MSEIKLIVVDMDETFLRQDKTYDLDKFKELLSELEERAIMFAIASGNSYHKLHEYFDAEDRQGMYFASDNGAHLVKDQEVIQSQTIPQAVVQEIVDFLDEFEGYHIVLSTGGRSYFRESQGRAYNIVRQYNVELAIVDDFDPIIANEGIVKIAVMSDHSLAQNKRVMRIFKERYPEIDSVTSGGGWLDVYAKTAGKGSSVRYLQEKYQIRPEETMTFGDSLNDLSMMQEAKYQMAMGNADPELIDQCAYVIGSNQDQAVFEVIEALLMNDDLSFLEDYRRSR